MTGLALSFGLRGVVAARKFKFCVAEPLYGCRVKPVHDNSGLAHRALRRTQRLLTNRPPQGSPPMNHKLWDAARWLRDRAIDLYACAVGALARHPALAFWLIAGLMVAAVL
jgi:hypothetical protein